MLKTLVTLPALACATLALPLEADAAKGGKAQFKYQSKPKNGQQCSGCRFYEPAKTAAANGACTLVAGSISPNAWCIAYAKKC